jgi:RNase adapter protein RapZ
MKFVIVTGLSGAGKSQALKKLEDLGFFCVDNLPPNLIPNFAEICLDGKRDKAATAVDMRMGDMFSGIFKAIEKLQADNRIDLDILFIDASDETIVKRFKETRRKHPLSDSGLMLDGIKAERQFLGNIQDIATHMIDTTRFSLKQFGEAIDRYFDDDNDPRISISITSFGFKRGIPLDADMVFDMRFLPNPFYIEELKNKTGLDKAVSDYVLSFDQANQFIDKILEIIELVSPHYLDQDKKQLVVAIGCTGGVHRSVAVSKKIYETLLKNDKRVTLSHRESALEHFNG